MNTPTSSSDATAFAPEWLALRETADARARNHELLAALNARFALRDRVSVVDIGCGTGANLRATAPLLPGSQHWTLIDNDAGLLAAARRAILKWADEGEDVGAGELKVRKGANAIGIKFARVDLANAIEDALPAKVDLVTASAFFDLVSAEFIRQFAAAVARRRAVFYGVLTYNGIQRWTPHRPQDNAMTSAFHRHQMRDKGFGLAAGPLAPVNLSDQFSMHDYSVVEGDSAWVLTRDDRLLIEETARGYALAVAETDVVPTPTIKTWINVKRTGAIVGHTDILAMPS